MLLAYFGTDIINIRKAAHECVEKFVEKGMTLEELTPENYQKGALSDLAGASSLFGGAQVTLIDTPSGDGEMFEDVFGNLKLLSESPNTFVLIEEKLLAPQKKKVEKYTEKATEIHAEKEERFNAFLLADAFLRRDKKSLWMLLIRAWREGLSNEEIIGIIYWQLKTMRLAERTKSASEAGQKPFVYQKAKRALSSFKEGELDAFSRDLLSIYHDGHLGKRDIDIALEKWVLTL